MRASSDLLAASMVSRLWRSAALPYLFRYISLPCAPSRNIVKEFTLFLSENPAVASHVRRLALSRGWPEKPAMIIVQALGSLLALLPRLDCLDIATYSVHNPSRDRPSRTFTLKELLWRDARHTLGELDRTFIDTLSLFSRVGQLHNFRSCVHPKILFNDLSATEVDSRVEHLVLAGYYSCENFISSFLLTDASRSLTSLYASPYLTSDLPGVGKLLERTGPTIKAVGIAFCLCIGVYGHFRADTDSAAGELTTKRGRLCTLTQHPCVL